MLEMRNLLTLILLMQRVSANTDTGRLSENTGTFSEAECMIVGIIFIGLLVGAAACIGVYFSITRNFEKDSGIVKEEGEEEGLPRYVKAMKDDKNCLQVPEIVVVSAEESDVVQRVPESPAMEKSEQGLADINGYVIPINL